ncbi:MAG TPA: NPCBM/NEW2 domain-containing protein, partial [Chitinophagaceae bacterium]|nr:NPCBM/NEW2 domain-containing protein [Chitinophagaceae bacterium]
LVIDDAWMDKNRNEKGELVPDPKKFPSGMKTIGDYIHSKGLKFGLYECRGIYTCQKLPGSFGHEHQDMKTFASWGVDYVKLDACFAERNNRSSEEDFAIYDDAIRKSGRPMILSISDFGNGSWAWGAKKYVHLWRTSYDIRATMGSVYYCANTSGGTGVSDPRFNGLWQFAGPGHWNDPDMLEVGNLKNTVEDKAHFSLWCILAAPLMAGNDLRTMKESVRNILTAPEIIAVDQDKRGVQGYKVYEKDGQFVYNKPLSDGTTAVLLLNSGDKPANISVRWEQIGLTGKQQVRDLWERKDLGSFRGQYTAYGLGKNELKFIKVGRPGSKLVKMPDPVPEEKFTAAAKGTTWLSDLYYLMRQGEAPVPDQNYQHQPITLNGSTYSKGIGSVAGSRIMYRLDRRASRLQAVIGVDDAYNGKDSVKFSIYNGDYFGGQIIYESPKMAKGSTMKVDIDVSNVDYVMLKIDGKEIPADWADIKVITR